MSHHHQNFDTTFTKIYVGGLPWTTRKEGLINFFKRFGEIIHVNVVCDRETDRSQGYGFVSNQETIYTFRLSIILESCIYLSSGHV